MRAQFIISAIVLFSMVNLRAKVQQIEDPLLVVVIMVKDEADVIEATLKPFVDGGIKNFVVFDTGSTDGTQEVAKKFFEYYAVEHAHILEEKFIDFATSRNHALDAAEKIFPRATFMLMPDAEWYMYNVKELLKFCADAKDASHPSYVIALNSLRAEFYTPRLIRCRKGVRFVGSVHEVLNLATHEKVPNTAYFEWRPSYRGMDKSRQRWTRDRDVLLKSLAEDPDNPRTLFYLGQTYECLQEWKNAYDYYKKRSKLDGWDEEKFIAVYRLGRVAEMLRFKDSKKAYSMKPVKHYLAASSMRPHRAEPLIKIAQYYRNHGDNLHLAFVFASRAAKLPYPHQDLLDVEKYLYEYVRYDILGICAWYVGEYDLGLWAVRKALKAEPDAQHLHSNLKLYTSMKNSTSKGIAAQSTYSCML
jgi:glycosyltransferase involved in cell wall biosynthesis